MDMYLLAVRCKLEDIEDVYGLLDVLHVTYQPLGRMDEPLLKSFNSVGYQWQ